MTRRERLESKLAKREEWAKGRDFKAKQCFARGEPYRGDIAFATQPGHIPERARVIRAMERGCEHQEMAHHHQSKAAGFSWGGGSWTGKREKIPQMLQKVQ